MYTGYGDWKSIESKKILISFIFEIEETLLQEGNKREDRKAENV